MNFLSSDLNKVSKYTIRLRKSVMNNDDLKIKEYYDHLKYHIQLGGLEQKDLEEKFKLFDSIITNLTNTEKGYKSFDNLYQELSKCNNEKTNSIVENNSLNAKIIELNKQLIDSTESVKQIDLIKQKDTTKDDKINELNKKIAKLNETIQDLELENKNNKEKLANFYTIIKEISNVKDLTINELKKQIEQVVDKISRYDEIIERIKGQIKDINNTDKNTFLNALVTLNSKLEKATELETQLKNANSKIDELSKKLVNIETIQVELEENKAKIKKLDDSIIEKDDEIKELTQKINILNNEKTTNDKTIYEFANNLDKKLKELLIKIYGSETIVDNIIDGKQFNESTHTEKASENTLSEKAFEKESKKESE